jgi:hypothetical protein
MKNINMIKGAVSIVAATIGFSSSVKAIDVDPLDYFAAPVGVNLGMIYSGIINEHTNLGADLDANINIARFIAYREFMGMTIDPQIIIPFGKQEIADGALEASGVADPILGVTFWLVNDDSNQFGITPFLSVPIGSYDNNDPLNLGKNTWEGTLQAGWIHKPTPNLALEAIADVTFSTDNDDFGASSETLEKDAAFQVQLVASYKLSNGATLGINLSRQWGGDTDVNNTVTEGAEITKVSLYTQYWFAPTLQVQGKYSRDLDVENLPFETQTFQLRLVKVF